MDNYQRAGLTFPVLDEGPVEADAVVLLHGFPQDPSAFAGVVPVLHARGLRTLVPTMRGYAPTARPQSRREYRTVETTADVVALLDAAGLQRAHVVGHDWGAAPAWAMAAWHPERVAGLTVLSTPHPLAMAAAFVSSSQAVKSWYMGFFQLPAVPELMIPLTLRKTLVDSHLPAEHVDRYCRGMAQPGALTGALNWYRALPFSARPVVGKSRVRTTYVWGRHDFALGRAAAERTGRYVDAPYRFIELDAGHWLPETHPQQIADLIANPAG